MELHWIAVAFALGFLARRFGQPPLLGFLAAGFVLEAFDAPPDAALADLTDVGIQLLLFTIGLKLDLRTVLRPQVWGVTAIHMLASVAIVAAAALGLGALGAGLFSGMDLGTAALIGFAASFSSTVFVVKVLEERDDLEALYGRVAIGILVVQDLAAVIFLAASGGKPPSPWALALLALVPLRPLLHRLLVQVGHGELLALFGLAATLGGAGLFEVVDLKGDLGALMAGVLLGGHAKTDELAKSLTGLKDIFLVGFFLSVGLTGLPTLETTLVGLGFLLLVPLKGALFFRLMTRSGLRARSATFAGISLSNYSEFGLIVGGVAVAKGWLPAEWLVVFATALAFSFLDGGPLHGRTYDLYRRLQARLARFERKDLIPEEQPVEAGDARALVLGMGRVGTGVYDTLRERYGDEILGFDIDADLIETHRRDGRRVVLANATEADFWDRLRVSPEGVELVLLAMSSQIENRVAIAQVRQSGCAGLIAATAQYDDELGALRSAGADIAFPVLAESGIGFGRHVLDALDADAEAGA